MASGNLGSHQIKSLYNPIVMVPKIDADEKEVAYPIKDMTIPIGDSWSAYGFVLRFRCENHKKAYFRTLEVFTVSDDVKEKIFFPLHSMRGVIRASNVSGRMSFEEKLIEWFKKTYENDFQIGT
jgi:hypothetical protein